MSSHETGKVEDMRTIKFSTVWLVPLLALIIAGWMIYDHWAGQGPQITLVAENAEGIEAGKTKVKARSIDIGEVEEVSLSENYEQALIRIQMDEGTGDMLRDDARFWVVKPRVGLKGVSGLGTMISGAYIEMEPGREGRMIKRFEMMPRPPLSTSEDKGIRLRLTSMDVAKMDIGTPVHFNGYKVGCIEKVQFNMETGTINYRIFIRAPYDSLINDKVQFWLTPGFSLSSTARGVEIRVDSLETLISGGISFGLVEGRKPGKKVEDMAEFRLYESKKAAANNRYQEFINYVFLFDSNVSGLKEGAPVEFRGIRIGTVKEVPFAGLDRDSLPLLQQQAIPVLASIEPQRLEFQHESTSPEYWRGYFEESISRGLRASLKTSNFFTGAQVIDMDFTRDTGPQKRRRLRGYPVFPTSEGGIEGLGNKFNALLDKINKLPLKDTIAGVNSNLENSNEAFSQVTELSRSLHKIMEEEAARQMPDRISASLQKLNSTLSCYSESGALGQRLQDNMLALEQVLTDFKTLIRQLRDQPSSLIFNTKRRPDPVPPAAYGEKE